MDYLCLLCFAGLTSDGYLCADGQPPGNKDYEEHQYVNTQNLDNLNLEGNEGARVGRPPDSPKKDLFDMSEPWDFSDMFDWCNEVISLFSLEMPVQYSHVQLWNFTVRVGPFEDALKLHEACGGAVGSSASAAAVGVQVLEDQWPSPPRRRAPVAPNEEQLRRETWYHSRMSRRDAERLLVRDGDFLVRESTTNPGQYVLTGMHCGLPKHLLLVDPEGVVSLLDLCSKHWSSFHEGNQTYSHPLLLSSVQVRTKDMLFESISHLISYHLQNELPIVAAESELHLRQVVRRKQWAAWPHAGW